ncbi:MAG TPA: hypothetical protein VGQ35_16570 [Dongiaceae bacterium]|jgi:hypothetical protein|nr:hypothetical protein [Dongiaceae bacterium]
MTKTIFHIHPMPRQIARPLALAALLVILVLSIGGALAQRMEQRASEDRLSIGDVAEQG